ncbi:MAG: Xaa-Pro dipeptidase [Wenzhouxiangella sp.]
MTMTQELLYARHIGHRREQVDRLLTRLGFDALLIHSGRPHDRLFDDQHPPFRAHAPFVAMVPLPHAADCLLEFQVGQKPCLWYCQPDDFWHLPPADPEAWWAGALTVETVADSSAWAPRFRNRRALAVIGAAEDLAGLGDDLAINPPALIHGLAEDRTVKTAWERECLHRANEVGARGHRAAAEACRSGASELEIHLAYLAAAGQDQDQLPYASIVALNEHAAVLHYQYRCAERPQSPRSFLLDAGAGHHGYGSDITRTWTAFEDGPFAALISELDALQQRLCRAMRADVDFVDLHRQAERGIAHILHHAGIIDMAADEMVATGVIGHFFPHGLGHFLGVQVHDVNGRVNPEGKALPAPETAPALRLTRRLAAGNVVTVEPGLYFIPMLLERLRASAHAGRVDWSAIDRLVPFGGIRIEDNVLVSDGEPVNLTRQAFAAAG